MKLKIQRKQLKTIAKYIYRPEFHGEWADLILALEETFDFIEVAVPNRINKVRARRNNMKVRRESPPPIPAEAYSRNHNGYKVTIHRGTPNKRTLCGTYAWEVVTTMEDSFVTCTNCLLPKRQEKLRQEESQDNDNQMGKHNPSEHLPIAPHFFNSNSSEI